MGQQSSKAVSRIAGAGKQALDKAVPSSAAATSAVAANVSPPAPTPSPPPTQSSPATTMTTTTTGSTRMDPRDFQQEQFLLYKHQQSALRAAEREGRSVDSTPGYKEMPADLLAFLNRAGPLQPQKEQQEKESTRTEKKKTTRMPWQLRGLEQQQQQQQEEESSIPANKQQQQHRKYDRIVESMPLAQKVPGFETMRTTNFSYAKDVVDPKQFTAGDIVDMYELLRRHEDPRVSQGRGLGMSLDDAVESFYQEHSNSHTWTSKEKARHTELLRNTLQHLELPVLMRDTDGSFVGASADRVADLKVMKLVEIPKSQIKLVLEDLADLQRATGPSQTIDATSSK